MDHGVQEVLSHAKQTSGTPVIEWVEQHRLVRHFDVNAAVLFVHRHASKEQAFWRKNVIAPQSALGYSFFHLHHERAELSKELLWLAVLTANFQEIYVGVVVVDRQAWVLLHVNHELRAIRSCLLCFQRGLFFFLSLLLHIQQNIAAWSNYLLASNPYLFWQRWQLSSLWICATLVKYFFQLLGCISKVLSRFNARHRHDALKAFLQVGHLIATSQLSQIFL